MQLLCIMRSKVTNESNWEAKWTGQKIQESSNVRRPLRKTEKLKLTKSPRASTSKERTLRRLESNERERMRMHSLNDAFQVNADFHRRFYQYNNLKNTCNILKFYFFC